MKNSLRDESSFPLLAGALIVLSMFLFVPDMAAQGGVKIQDLSEIQQQAEEGSDTLLSIAKYAIGTVLGIGLVFVAYSLITNNPRAKEYVIGWFIAVVITLIGFMVI